MDVKKISLFLAFAFGISWLAAGVMYALDLPYGKGFSLFIVACFYMPAPAFAALIVQKYIYKEQLADIGWKWKGIRWGWIIGTILMSMFFVLGTMGVMYLGGNVMGYGQFGTLDFSTDAVIQKITKIVNTQNPDLPVDIEAQLEQLPFEFSAAFLIGVSLIGAILAAFTVNLPFMFGEEFGWRGLLIRETQSLGFMKSNLLIGVFWGLWHAPIILMGHNYPEYPVIGVGMMVLFCVALSYPFAYVRYKTNSILGACILHGMINGSAALTLYFTWGGHSLVTGMTGLAGFIVIALVLFFILIFDRSFVSSYSRQA